MNFSINSAFILSKSYSPTLTAAPSYSVIESIVQAVYAASVLNLMNPQSVSKLVKNDTFSISKSNFLGIM